jgi:hypothetical protein
MYVQCTSQIVEKLWIHDFQNSLFNFAAVVQEQNHFHADVLAAAERA